MSELLVGTAVVDITPPLGTSLAGYFEDRIADSIHDPLEARALVVAQGDEPVALVGCDLLGMIAPQVARIRSRANALCGIPEERILIHCTHTHTGPRLPRYFVADPGDLEAALYPGRVDEAYSSAIEEKIAGAIAVAMRNWRPAPGIGWAIGREEDTSFVRRYRMKDGSVRMNPGIGNPDVAGPVGENDPDVIAISFGLPGAALLSWACHPDVIGGTGISADWPGHAARNVRQALNADCTPVFLNGTCGDLNHINLHDPTTAQRYVHSQRMGWILAGEALKLLAKARPAPMERLDVASRMVPLPLRSITPEEGDAAARLLAEPTTPHRERCFAAATLALARTREPRQAAEVQVMRLGPAAVVGLPGEIFSRLGREIKRRSPFPATMVCGLANGSIGYIPTEDAYADGGYETSHRSARFRPGSGEMLVTAAVEMLHDLA